MKIAVIAAGGRTGRAFVAAALRHGHTVRAGVRGKNPFQPQPGLEVVACDATHYKEVSELIRGQDAVVSLIGHVRGSPADVQSAAIQTVIRAMQRRHMRRIVSLTGTGVRFPDDNIPLFDELLNAALHMADPSRLEDGDHHAEALVQSGLDWTIVRVLKLTNGGPRPFRLTAHGPTKPFVSRSDVAEAILDVLKHNSFHRVAPILSR